MLVGAAVDSAAPAVLRGGEGDGATSLRRRDSAQLTIKSVRTFLSSVIGSDDRIIEFDTRRPPARQVCALEIEWPQSREHGTGWMAGPSLVITCGHCVFRREEGGWPRRIMVTAGLSEGLAPFGRVAATAFSAPDPWMNGAEKPFDIGAIHLDSPIGSRTGWFRMAAADDTPGLIGRDATIAGYPSFDGEHNRQLRESNRIVAVEGGRIYHTIDTDSGQSGAPIWIDAGGIATVVGVHAYEADQTPRSISAEANSGTLLTRDMLARVDAWQR